MLSSAPSAPQLLELENSAAAVARPPVTFYFQVTAVLTEEARDFFSISEVGPSNEISSTNRPITLGWYFDPQDLEFIEGFRLYYGRRSGSESNFVSLGKSLTTIWPPVYTTPTNILLTWSSAGASIYVSSDLSVPFVLFTNAPGESLLVPIDAPQKFFSSPDRALQISPR